MKAIKRLRWTIVALLAIAAVAVIRLFGGGDTVERDGLTYAAADLDAGLDSTEPKPGVRVLASFEDGDRVPCRAFIASGVSGIACRRDGAWHIRVGRPGVSLDDPAAVAEIEAALLSAADRMKR